MVSYLKSVFYTELMVTYFLGVQSQRSRNEEQGKEKNSINEAMDVMC